MLAWRAGKGRGSFVIRAGDRIRILPVGSLGRLGFCVLSSRFLLSESVLAGSELLVVEARSGVTRTHMQARTGPSNATAGTRCRGPGLGLASPLPAGAAIFNKRKSGRTTRRQNEIVNLKHQN